MASKGALLEDTQRDILQQERELVSELQLSLEQFAEIDPAHVKTLRQVLVALDELFLLVVVGEFNAGKSATINALLHEQVLEEGVIPTTAKITLLRYGEQQGQKATERDMLDITYPADFLRDITIVDTPGVNAVLRHHEQLTEEFIPRCDLVLFITSVDRPFTESERAFLEKMRAWGKKIVIVLNKIDLLHTSDELKSVTNFVGENCRTLLGFEPEIFPVSAQIAQKARTENGPDAIQIWEKSRFGPLEHFLFDTLDEAERVRLKLLTPLGVMQRLLTETRHVVEQRARLLAEDALTIDTIEHQMQLYREDMERDFNLRLGEVENIILEMRERGDRFFDDTIRFGRIFDLMRPEKIKGDFQTQVVGDSERRIDNSVQQLIDWMVEQEQRFWQDVMEYMDQRKEISASRESTMMGSVGKKFDYNRRALLQEVARSAGNVLKTYDREAEAVSLSQNMRASVVQAGLVSAGGVGLGAIVVAATTIAALDITGVIAGVMLIGLGVYIIPSKRKRGKRDFNAKMDDLRARLHVAMTEQFRHELANSISHIKNTIAPYTRFIRGEQERTSKALTNIIKMENEVINIGNAIDAMQNRK